MSRTHPRTPRDHEPTSVEDRLARMAVIHPSADLRQRVLAAVESVLAEPPADMARDEAQWSLLATVAAAGLLVASWGGSLGLGRSVADAIPPEQRSFTARLAAAGVRLEPLTPARKKTVEPL